MRAVATVASIDIKAAEAGLLEFCKEKSLNFVSFSADELSAVCGDFSSSEFVRGVTGVDNVCERSAVLAASRLATREEVESGEPPELIVKKCSGNGVTVAVAMKKRRMSIE